MTSRPGLGRLARRTVPVALAAGVLVASGCTVDGTPVADPAPAPVTATTTTSTDDWDSGDSPAMTTEPPVSEPPVSEVPPPPNATTMRCREFVTLDKSTQIAVLRANGATADADRLALAATLAESSCPAFPDLLIADLVAGNIPE